MSDENEDPEIVKLRERVKSGEIHADHLEDAECGYTYAASIDEVKALTPVQIHRLALMALRWYDSPWSDKDRDLFRGVTEVVGRKSEHKDNYGPEE